MSKKLLSFVEIWPTIWNSPIPNLSHNLRDWSPTNSQVQAKPFLSPNHQPNMNILKLYIMSDFDHLSVYHISHLPLLIHTFSSLVFQQKIQITQNGRPSGNQPQGRWGRWPSSGTTKSLSNTTLYRCIFIYLLFLFVSIFRWRRMRSWTKRPTTTLHLRMINLPKMPLILRAKLQISSNRLTSLKCISNLYLMKSTTSF